MSTSVPPQIAPSADAQAVEAIRQGDTDRFRELVERHADRVYAVAWARLGNRSLAEEATQLTFINGFRRLAMLGHAERFGAWITTIARRTSINLGLRHRGEARKQERWADLAEADPNPPNDSVTVADSAHHHLGAALDALSPSHRECLTLFYLERQSVVAAADSLGISESAFKVRLHRARTALREELLRRLEDDLGSLRAPERLVPSVMLALPAASAPAGSLALGIASLWKSLPFGVSLLALQLLMLLPGPVFLLGLQHLESGNYRDPAGFARRAHRRMGRRILLLVLVSLTVASLLSAGLSPQAYAALVVLFVGTHLAQMTRSLRVIDLPTQRAFAVALACLGLAMLPSALGHPIPGLLPAGLGAFFLVFAWVTPRLAPRMDHSLFARAARGCLGHDSPRADKPGTGQGVPRLSRAQLLEFGRFLGREELITDWSWEGFTLVLTLPGPGSRPGQAFLPPRWTPASRLALAPSGHVEAHLAPRDHAELGRLLETAPPAPAELEARVAQGLDLAWTSFRSGRSDRARTLLGGEPESALFRKPHARTFSTRLRVAILILGALVMFADALRQAKRPQSPQHAMARTLLDQPPGEPAIRGYLTRLEAQRTADSASAPPREVTSFLGLWNGSPAPLPPKSWWTEAQRRAWLRGALPTQWPDDDAARAVTVLAHPLLLRHLIEGSLEPSEIPEPLRNLDTLRRGLRQTIAAPDAPLLEPMDSQVHGQSWRVLDLRLLNLRLQWIERLELLDEARPRLLPWVDRVLACQVQDSRAPTNRWPCPAPSQLDGLFLLMAGDPIVDTWHALEFLRLAGAQHRVDADRTRAGILRLHRGQGLFAPAELVLGLQVAGEARHTFAAWQALGLLDAESRLTDLTTWRFRFPASARLDHEPALDPYLAWPALEAAACARAFQPASAHPKDVFQFPN